MDYSKTKVRVVYRQNLDPVSVDPVYRLIGESYWVRDVEQALLAHPRAEISSFEGERSEPTTTEQAKRLAGLLKRKPKTPVEDLLPTGDPVTEVSE
jgi:hypothetical protein